MPPVSPATHAKTVERLNPKSLAASDLLPPFRTKFMTLRRRSLPCLITTNLLGLFQRVSVFLNLPLVEMQQVRAGTGSSHDLQKLVGYCGNGFARWRAGAGWSRICKVVGGKDEAGGGLGGLEIGRAACRERGEISGGAG